MSAAHSVAGLSNGWVTSLRKLQLKENYLMGLHPYGLSASSALQVLQCVGCWITSGKIENDVVFFGEDCPIHMPSRISLLTSLSRLVLVLASPAALQDEEMFDLAAVGNV